MYSRNTRNGWYGVPPGYTGSTFIDGMTVKHHEPDKADAAFPVEPDRNEHSIANDNRIKDKHALEELVSILHGKIGTEEMIILLVMLLTATEGVGVETLLLALVLLAR